MFEVTITTEYSFKPIKVFAISYKIKRGFLSLDLKNNKKIAYNLNKIEKFEVEEIEDDMGYITE